MIRFAKYHGCGNDFIIVTEEAVRGLDYSELAQNVCHRTTGIGADGFIVVRDNPLEMVFYNSDGSRAPMCGNGIRCFAKYCYDEGINRASEYPVVTLAGTMGVKVKETIPFLVEINMGKPDFDPKSCAIETDLKDFLKQNILTSLGSVEVSTCFMGTIHTVTWIENLDIVDVEKLGAEISNHSIYTEKTNVNMVQIIDRSTLRLMTYERGAGMTYACGTGACASAVIGILENKCENEVDVILPYGKLHITQRQDKTVMMTGPAVKIGEGHLMV